MQPPDTPRHALSREDIAFVAGLRRRDDLVYQTLVRRYQRAMHRVAGNYVRDPDTASDVVQETWMVVLLGIDRFEGRSALKTWIFNILVNRAKTRGVSEARTLPWSSLRLRAADADGGDDFLIALDWLSDDRRGTRQRRSTVAPERSPERQVEEYELMAIIKDRISALAPTQRTVIALRDIHGFSGPEVCEHLGITQTNQRVLLHRARVAVRAALVPYLAIDGPPTAELA